MAPPKRTVQGPAEGLALQHLEGVAYPDVALLQVAEHLGIEVGDPDEATALAGLEVRQAARVDVVDHEVGVGDGIAMGIVRRITELGRDPRLDVLGERVLERLGLLVHAVPGYAQVLGQVELEQPVVAHHLEREALALLPSAFTPR